MTQPEPLRGSAADNFDGSFAALRVREVRGPLGTVRLTVRAIGSAEGYVFCRHRRSMPFALTHDEWQALPLASEVEYDI